MSNGLLFIGVEKNNDDSKRHYFSSNKHDAAGEIIRCEARLHQNEALSMYFVHNVGDTPYRFGVIQL